ncbi:PorP/SprF family type IX secretion system membrane protein [Aureibacter tunicatorum]|uniref:Type IX secretion system PorP/SprF family membrane protein n=1 Tax=Aureibacter tunicatorum TaxID=866807 RepID=A0AAE4BQR9_9BACT|nr:type IX secretion system membrane protein PorP/SprF [Aureibacter tunicatorum]MDR6237208.1 type IX secretion system PorP/SprF family membrane protein [Aureibacter tunicatorum]BDD06200.1 membrane protein [Aureibacter tunicatorum]
MKRFLYNFLLLLLALLLSDRVALGQNDAQLTQYMFNKLVYNPAYAGVEGVTNITALYRSQWLGYQASIDQGGAPSTALITFDAPILRLNSGLGLQVLNDQLGPQNNLNILLAYAYHLELNDYKLSFALQGGVISQTIDFDKYRWLDPDDPFNRTGKESQVRPDLSIGFFLQSQKLYAGLSYNHLIDSEFDFGVENIQNPLEKQLNFMMGYDIMYNYDVIITPSVLFRTDFTGYALDVSTLLEYKQMFWGGLSYRYMEAVSAILGYAFLKDKSLRIGYSLDYIVHHANAKATTSHEFMLNYLLPLNVGKERKIIRTPRFRH